jgi:type VI secretion system secreted protein Hcp
MALNAYLRLTGETQGEIRGSVTQAGREDSILVMAVDHQFNSPRDAASGLPTGRRQHQPIVITKEIDRASPLLAAVLARNENITDWRLDFWRPSRSGQEEQFYTIELVNASISGIKLVMLNNAYPENMQLPEMEKVAFTYQKIIWTYQDGGITAEDDWLSPAI